MTGLKNSLVLRIKQHGPIGVAEYMAECLFHPKHGYYVKNEPFGAQGDFITAPDISQMFGELTAIWLVRAWEALGSPTKFTLCEIGPGRGTWMKDIIATLAKLEPAMLAAMQIYMVEKSDRLTNQQRLVLREASCPTIWIDSIEQLPAQPILLIANELFDALPTRQFIKTANGWIERVIGVDEKDELIFTFGTATVDLNLLPIDAPNAPHGTIFEYAPAREAFAQQIATHIVAHTGGALLIDYGHSKSGFGDTLQAVKNHTYEDVFKNPGDADITSHVDFEALNIAAKSLGAQHHEIISQADFLLSLGLLERAGTLGAEKRNGIQEKITADVRRLAGNDKDEMGDLFQVMYIAHNVSMTIAPFRNASTNVKM